MAPCAAGEDAVALAPDFAANVEVTELRAGDPGPNGGTIEIEAAIEIGNIFKLGTRYSEPLGATYLDESGVERPVVMGSYGIGPARIVAAAIEQRADERGIVWPAALAPWQVQLVSLAKAGEDGARRGRRPLRASCARRARRCSTTTATPGRGRS